MKNIKIIKNKKIKGCFKNKNGIHDSTGHGVHNIIIYNIVSQSFQIPFHFQDFTLFVGIYE